MTEQLSGIQKSAVLLITMGAEVSAQIFKNFNDETVEQLTKEIIKMQDVQPLISEAVTDEFYHMVLAKEYILQGGIMYAQSVLERALGNKKAMDVISKIQGSIQQKGFKMLNEVDPNQLLNFIQKEHPQTIALVLSQINRRQAATIISELPQEIQTNVIYRIANMDQVSPELVKEVEDILESRIDFTTSGRKIGGVKTVAEVLNLVEQSTEKAILGELAKRDADLAEEVEKLMFIFEDIILLSDRSIQQILSRVDNKDLALALKACSEDTKTKIFNKKV